MAPGGVEDLDTYLAMPGIANMFNVYKSGKTGPEAMRAVMSMQVVDQSLLTEEIINERAPIALTQTEASRQRLYIPNMTEQLPDLLLLVAVAFRRAGNTAMHEATMGRLRADFPESDAARNSALAVR